MRLAAFLLMFLGTSAAQAAADKQAFDVIARGRYLAIVGDCAGCHNAPGGAPYAGGLPIETPFGTLVSPNITPDRETGIGAWTDDEFVNAMQDGTRRGGEHLYPAFPYPAFTKLTDADVAALFAYLKSLAPVKYAAPANELRFPFNQRNMLIGWRVLFFSEGEFKPDPTKSVEWNRGAYLANAAGHCAECHSVRNVLGGLISRQLFAGGPNLEGDGWVPNITQKGLADWSEKDIAYMLETGQTPDGDSVGSSMTALVRCPSRLTDADRAAIATYIKSLPPVEGPPKPPKKVAIRPCCDFDNLLRPSAVIPGPPKSDVSDLGQL